MSFHSGSCALVLDPPDSVSGRFNVKLVLTTESGGTDAIIAYIDVNLSLLRPNATEAAIQESERRGPNPTRGTFAVPTPLIKGAIAELGVYDLAGRRLATVRGSAGSRLTWDGRDAGGAQVAPGLYLYRLDVGRHRQQGKIVVVR